MSLFPLDGPAGPITGVSTFSSQHDATPLVLLHGIQGSASAWNGVLEHLPTHIPAVVPNLRGRGGSAEPRDPADYSLEAFASDLAAVLSKLDRPAVLAGWSMGVLVSLAYLARYGQEHLRALTLISGTAQGDACQWFMGNTTEAIAAEAEDRAVKLALLESASPLAAAGAWLSVRKSDYRWLLPRIELPTLVIHGTADDQCPLAHGELIAEQICDAQLAVHEDGGHNILAQNTRQVAEQLAYVYDRHA